MPSLLPADAVACNYRGASYLYYVCDNGTISSIEGPKRDSSEDNDKKQRKEYGNPVRITYADKDGNQQPAEGNTEEPTLAVVNYERKDANGQQDYIAETRLFYIDKNLHELCELRWTGSPGEQGGKCYRGALTWKRWKPVEKSLLAAVEDGQTIKVYYQDEEGGNNLTVAWANRDDDSADAWKKRAVANKF